MQGFEQVPNVTVGTMHLCLPEFKKPMIHRVKTGPSMCSSFDVLRSVRGRPPIQLGYISQHLVACSHEASCTGLIAPAGRFPGV